MTKKQRWRVGICLLVAALALTAWGDLCGVWAATGIAGFTLSRKGLIAWLIEGK